MISLRQHVTSLVAVFLALAVGIVLGGGLFAGGGDDDPAGEPTQVGATSRPEPAEPQETTYADAFAEIGAPRLYADGLNGHAAALLALPGTSAATIEAVQTQITAAGGAITGTYTVSDSLLDPDGEDEVDQTGSELVTQLADPRLDGEAPTYERMGALLSLAMSTTQPSSVRADLAAVTVRETLASAGLLESPTDVRNAPLVLVLLPPGEDGGSDSPATRTVLGGLVNGLAANAAGVVVAGDADSAEDGALAAIREGELTGLVSTVDGTESSLGQVTTVLALIAVVAGTTGAFGASGADGAVPLP